MVAVVEAEAILPVEEEEVTTAPETGLSHHPEFPEALVATGPAEAATEVPTEDQEVAVEAQTALGEMVGRPTATRQMGMRPLLTFPTWRSYSTIK